MNVKLMSSRYVFIPIPVNFVHYPKSIMTMWWNFCIPMDLKPIYQKVFIVSVFFMNTWIVVAECPCQIFARKLSASTLSKNIAGPTVYKNCWICLRLLMIKLNSHKKPRLNMQVNVFNQLFSRILIWKWLINWNKCLPHVPILFAVF